MRRLLGMFAVLPLLAGCGSDSDDKVSAGDPYTALLAASATTAEAGAARFTMTIDAGSVNVKANGVMDMAKQLAAIDMEMPGLGTMKMVVDRTTMYMQLPSAAGQALGATTPWVSIDMARAGEVASGIAGGGMTGPATDPGDLLSALNGVSEGGVRRVGTSEVRGVSTTQYHAEIDLRKAAEMQSSVADQATFEQFMDQMGDEPKPVDVWLDDDGVVRKFSMSMAVQGTDMTMVMEFYDFGEVDPPAIPAAGDVTDITDQAISQAQARR